MKITLSNNIREIGCAIETDNSDNINLEQIKKEGAEKYARSIQNRILNAYEAADEIFAKYPEFRQVTLDTMTDEERRMAEQAAEKGGAGC